MVIKAVIFDMGGTIETYGYTRELRLEATTLIRERLEQAGINLHLTDEQLFEIITSGLESYKRWSMQSMEELPPLRVWSEYVFRGQGIELAQLMPIAEELMFLIETRFYERAMRPEVPAVLETIKRMGLKIGLISNVNSRGQVPSNLEKYGIIQYFDPIVLSSEYGRRKPDPAIFHYAARLANVPVSQCIYIGDRLNRDIAGARRAGYCQAIQIEHDFEHGEDDDGSIPDAVILQMTELPDILREHDRNQSLETPHRPICAILFDAGDVLYFRPERGKKLAGFLQDISLKITENHLVQKESLTNQAFQGCMTQDQYREATLRLYGVTQPEDIKRGKEILDEEDNDVHFFDGVTQTLASLKQQGYLLGVITDTANPVHVKLGWFENGGFGNVWDTIISSNEIGVRKPHPKIYQAALKQLGLAAGQAVFVGHKTSEIEGARAVGMHTIAFNHDADARADYYIQHFADLLKLPYKFIGSPLALKVSLSTMWAIGKFTSLREFMEEASRLGFDQVELNHQIDSRMLIGIDLKHAPISSIHEPCPSDIPVDILKARDWMISASDEDCRRQGVNAIKRSIELAGSIGVKTVVVHAGNVHFDWPREKELYTLFKAGQAHTQQYNDLKACLMGERAAMVGPRLAAVQKSLTELIEYAGLNGVCLGLENRYHYMDIPLPEEMESLLTLAGPELIGFWYDVGHAQALDRLGFYPHLQWLGRFAERIVGVHLHDVIGINDHNAPGLGEVDFNCLLPRIPPEAVITLEVKSSLSPEQVKNSLKFLEKFRR